MAVHKINKDMFHADQMKRTKQKYGRTSSCGKFDSLYFPKKFLEIKLSISPFTACSKCIITENISTWWWVDTTQIPKQTLDSYIPIALTRNSLKTKLYELLRVSAWVNTTDVTLVHKRNGVTSLLHFRPGHRSDMSELDMNPEVSWPLWHPAGCTATQGHEGGITVCWQNKHRGIQGPIQVRVLGLDLCRH